MPRRDWKADWKHSAARKGGRTAPRPHTAARERRADDGPVILYGWHPVRAALENPARRIRRLFATENAIRRLAEEVIRRVDPNVKIDYLPYSRAYGDDFEDVRRRVPDVGRLFQTVGSKPQMPLGAI